MMNIFVCTIYVSDLLLFLSFSACLFLPFSPHISLLLLKDLPCSKRIFQLLLACGVQLWPSLKHLETILIATNSILCKAECNLI